MESFYQRQRYFAQPITFMNKMILGLPPLIALILALIPLGIIESQAFNFPAYIVATFLLILIPILKLFSLTPKLRMEVLGLFLYPFTIGIILLFVTGFQTPILVFWLVLLILAYANFGLYGYLFTSAALLAIGFLDLFIYPEQTVSYFISTVFYIFYLNVVGFIIATVLEVTAKSEKSLEQTRSQEARQRDRLNTVINSMAEGVLSVNQNGIVNIQNAKMLEILDTNQQLEGKHVNEVFDLIDNDNQPVDVSLLASENNYSVIRNDLRHKFSPREKINLRLQISPIRTTFHRNDSVESYVIIVSDITKQKTLDDERDEFISVVSHELRTPVAVAEGSLSNLLLMQKKGMDSKKLHEAADAAHEQVLFLAKMINDLGTLSRAERGVGDAKEEIDLNELFKMLYDNYRDEAAKKGLHLNLDIPGRLPKVVQSRLYLEEMLQNFITNALKYTFKGSVTIHVHRTKNGIECAVSDTGIGISTSDQKKIFQKFYRSEDYRTRETGGTGLGLYVVQKLADKMNVKIEVKSRLNHGSRFSFTMPLKKS